jgi:hypothetical protein
VCCEFVTTLLGSTSSSFTLPRSVMLLVVAVADEAHFLQVNTKFYQASGVCLHKHLFK